MVYEGTALNPFAAEVLGADQRGSSGGDANTGEAAPVLTPNSSGLTEDVRDVPRTKYFLLFILFERLREELRSDLYETDRDLESRERLGRAERSVQPPLPTGAQTSSSSTSLAVPSRPNRREERRRSNSIEIISPSPPAVADLEQRAGRLIITPERRHPKREEQDEEHSPNSSAVSTRITGKHRRGLDLLKTGDNSSSNTDDSEPTTSKGCTASRTRPSKRKIGVTIIRFPTHPSEPGPSYVSETHEEPMVGDTVENQAEEAGDSNEADNIKVFSEHMY
ncbi:unnamed protein product [Cylicostephanus goldi]|uniref:Uncharacterized protein n=1 Tax=Cylicostephanus goldi TaxID=71465 RepID=A0A3P6QBG5_CYLGO|nr:unnamed protein product [Cylicostephanus goldi]